MDDDLAGGERECPVQRNAIAKVLLIAKANNGLCGRELRHRFPDWLSRAIVDEDQLGISRQSGFQRRKKAGKNSTPLNIGTITLTPGKRDNP